MKKPSQLIMYSLLIFGIVGCIKSQFFEDTNDPGLSRFTSRGYNVSSAYINNEPWVSNFEKVGGLYSQTRNINIYKKETQSEKDTLQISWDGNFTNDSIFNNSPWKKYKQVSLSFPVNKNFGLKEFLAWSGKRFPADTTLVNISLGTAPFYFSASITGTGNVYFVSIKKTDSSSFSISGLFEGKIGDSITISKGRFDYAVYSNDHNLQ